MNIYTTIGLGMMFGAAWIDTTFAWKSKLFMYVNVVGVCILIGSLLLG